MWSTLEAYYKKSQECISLSAKESFEGAAFTLAAQHFDLETRPTQPVVSSARRPLSRRRPSGLGGKTRRSSARRRSRTLRRWCGESSVCVSGKSARSSAKVAGISIATRAAWVRQRSTDIPSITTRLRRDADTGARQAAQIRSGTNEACQAHEVRAKFRFIRGSASSRRMRQPSPRRALLETATALECRSGSSRSPP
jgi:hypothetical protein